MDEALRREVRPRRSGAVVLARPGTKRTSATGAARRRSSASCTTMRSTASGVRCRTRGSAVPTRAGSGGQWMRDFLEHQLARQELRHRADRHADRLRLVPRQGPADLRRRSRAHGDREPARGHRRRVPDHRVVSGAEVEADRDWRVRPRGLRRLPGTAARIPQFDDVFELHGGELRAEARSGRSARREPRGGVDVGVRVRGPRPTSPGSARSPPTASTCRSSTCSA